MIRIKFKVGKSQVECESTNLKKIFRFSGLMGGLPSKCDHCNSENIYLSHKAPSGNDYYMVVCKDCGAALNFHQKKEGGFYLKYDEKMEVYKKDESTDIKSTDIKKQVDSLNAKDSDDNIDKLLDKDDNEDDIQF